MIRYFVLFLAFFISASAYSQNLPSDVTREIRGIKNELRSLQRAKHPYTKVQVISQRVHGHIASLKNLKRQARENLRSLQLGLAEDVVINGSTQTAFVFLVTSADKIVLETFGNVDTYLTLKSSDGRVVARDNNSGNNRNARIEADLRPDRYLVVLQGGSSSSRGTTSLLASSETPPDDDDGSPNSAGGETHENLRGSGTTTVPLFVHREGRITQPAVFVHIETSRNSDFDDYRLSIRAPDGTVVVLQQNNNGSTVLEGRGNRLVKFSLEDDAVVGGLQRLVNKNVNGQWELIVYDDDDDRGVLKYFSVWW